jgi:hypothetical protein
MALLKLTAAAGLAALAIAATGAVPAQAASCVVDVHFARGGDRAEYNGTLTQARPGCTYLFKAKAGQKLIWRVEGPATRQVVTSPSGNADGPGIANPYPLTETGLYRFDLSADLMADGAFGRYRLVLIIR